MTATVRRERSVADYLGLAIATCGVGYFPLAPGTLGSLFAVGIFVTVQFYTLKWVSAYAWPNGFLLYFPSPVIIAVELAIITAVTLIGIWAASRTEQLSGRKDPGKVIIDEVAGQLIALLPVMPRADARFISIAAAFLLFRFFDITKPYPARRLEGLESGLGIMADDLVAGAYAAVVVSMIISVRLLLL